MYSYTLTLHANLTELKAGLLEDLRIRHITVNISGFIFSKSQFWTNFNWDIFCSNKSEHMALLASVLHFYLLAWFTDNQQDMQ